MDQYGKPIANISQRPMTQAIFSAAAATHRLCCPHPCGGYASWEDGLLQGLPPEAAAPPCRIALLHGDRRCARQAEPAAASRADRRGGGRATFARFMELASLIPSRAITVAPRSYWAQRDFTTAPALSPSSTRLWPGWWGNWWWHGVGAWRRASATLGRRTKGRAEGAPLRAPGGAGWR